MLANLVMDDFENFFNKRHPKKNDKELYLDKYKPELLTDLAVHKNKISELELCLQKILSGKAFVILLTGPSGSAKTTALNLIAKKLNLDVQEWANSINEEYVQKSFFSEDATSESQKVKFSDFLFRASRYDSLCFDEKKIISHKLSIIKDFPNFLLRDPTILKDFLLKYNKKCLRNPLVFIVTDTEQSSNIKRKLFPEKLIKELSIEVVKFNPIAPTSMMKALQRITNLIPNTATTKQELEEIVQESNGDIRSACNLLQFLGAKLKKPMKSKRILKEKKTSFSKKKSSDLSLEQRSIGSKDMGISLFRVLGKILHCKRLPEVSINIPDQSTQFHRAPMAFDPDSIFHKSCLSIDLFISFLHQNYPPFFNSFEDLSEASEYLSETDMLSGNWWVREKMSSYQASLVTRGLMFANTSSAKPSWMPLHKPQSLLVHSARMELINNIQDNFSECFHHYNNTKMSTELLPYLSLLNRYSMYQPIKLTSKKDNVTGYSFSQTQKQILCSISQCNQFSSLERFDDKERPECDTYTNVIRPSNDANITSMHIQNDFDESIEEYDSDD